MVEPIESMEDLFDLLDQNKDTLVVIDYWADWCGPCKKFKPEFDKISRNYSTVLFCTINIDDVPEVKEEFEISSIPTFDLIKNGQRVHRVAGAQRAELEQAIREMF